MVTCSPNSRRPGPTPTSTGSSGSVGHGPLFQSKCEREGSDGWQKQQHGMCSLRLSDYITTRDYKPTSDALSQDRLKNSLKRCSKQFQYCSFKENAIGTKWKVSFQPSNSYTRSSEYTAKARRSLLLYSFTHFLH